MLVGQAGRSGRGYVSKSRTFTKQVNESVSQQGRCREVSFTNPLASGSKAGNLSRCRGARAAKNKTIFLGSKQI